MCLQDRLPAYISWEQYQANVEQLQRNRGSVRGTPRQGSALLAGVVWCGKCGRRMTTHYSGTDQRLRYDCMAEARARLGRPCQTLCGTDLDRLVEELVLQAVQPAALEVSLRVAADLDAERTQLERHWRQRLEQAQYQADRARRQYAAVEPEHRLVARQLEREWNDALAAAAQLQDEYERYLAQRSRAVTAAERAEIQRLAEDIPAIWRAPTTTVADRKVIIGLLVERVVVTVVGQSELVEVVVHWQGGHESQALLRRPMRYAKNISNRDVFGARAIELQQQGMTLGQIAECLNQEGFRAPRGGVLTTYTVHATLAGLGLTRKKRPSEPRRVEDRRPNEVPLLEAAARVGMPAQTLRVWLKSGKAQGRVAHHQGHPVTLIRLDDTELQRLRDLRSQPAKGKAYTV